MSVVFGPIVGLALGLTGGGGSIFAVPLLIYGLGVDVQSAVTISLAVVAVTSGVGAAQSWRHGTVELRAGLIFAVASVVAAPLGVLIGGYVGDLVTIVLFASLMLMVALRMGLKALQNDHHSTNADSARSPNQTARGAVCHYTDDGRLRLTTPCGIALVGGGVLVGILSGFLGVGGGFLIVPALVLFTEIKIHRAVTTSLLVITLTGLSGFVSATIAGREVDWALAGLFLLGGIAGMFGGRQLARILPEWVMLYVFTSAMAVVGVFMLLKQLLFVS